MSTSITLDQAIDIGHSTLQHIQTKKAANTFLYETYSAFNSYWRDRVRFQGGDKIEGEIVLGDEGNAKHSGLWDEDTHNVVNITKTYELKGRHATSNFSYNVIEADLNRGPERVYNLFQVKYDNMCREVVDKVYAAMWGAPSSASDETLPYGIPCWLSIGTNGSTGGWTGYQSRYNDGNTPGTAFDTAGLTSDATTNARWASYYADHNGNLDDSLLLLLDKACTKLNFEGPQFPKSIDLNTPGYSPSFSLYTSYNVQSKVKQLYAKSDDQMGFRPNAHFGKVPEFKSMALQYVPVLDTANNSLYGTDPIFGVNHNMIFPMVLNGWDFDISKPEKRTSGNQHLVATVYCDVFYQNWCLNRRHAGFQISQHGTS